MTTTSRLAALVLAAAALLAPGTHAATDLADIPMAVRNNAPPNFMFMLDNSGSMSNIVPDAPYDTSGATSYLPKDGCPSNRTVSADDIVSLRVVRGAPAIQLKNSCGDGCTFGTGRGSVCFDDNTTYTDVRLLATESCGNNCRTSAGANYLSADYSGRYLNWYFGTGAATGWGDRKPGTETRLEIAKEGAKAAIDTIPLKSGTAAKARVGLVTYNGDSGGTLLRGVADLDTTHRTNIKASIDALTSTGRTPLAETLADIGQYFSLGYTGNVTIHPGRANEEEVSIAALFRQGSTSPHKLAGAPANCSGAQCPVQYWCQGSYAILMTDGRPQSDQALSTNPHLCDYDGDSGGCTTSGARKYGQKTGGAATIHAGHLGGAHSYESEGSDYLDDVAQALFETDLRPDLDKRNGDETVNGVRTYTVGFADLQAQNDPLMQEAAKQGGGLFLRADNVKTLTDAFVGAMNNAQQVDAAAAAVAVTSAQIQTDTITYASSYFAGLWTGDLEAFSVNTSTGLPIQPRLWSAREKLDAVASAHTVRNIVSYGGGGGKAFSAANFRDDTAGLTPEVIDFLRGARSGEGTLYRTRASILGDAINAEPVLVRYGSKNVVFQAANDGMLHVFDGGTGAAGGKELWAYVPGLVVPNLPQLARPEYAHRYYVDATPGVGDVSGGFSGKLLVGGLGKGGRGYYALDITDYAASGENAAAAKVLWETAGSDAIGYTFGTPQIVKTPRGWVVLVTSGYDNGDGGGHLLALDPKTGTVLHDVATGGPTGLTHLGRLAHTTPGQTEKFVYAGDLSGNVWRFDLTSWSAVRIAKLVDAGGGAQPVTSAPAVKEIAGAPGKHFVYVGTGQYLGDSDVPGNSPQNAHATQKQSVYAIIDDTASAAPELPDIRGGNGGGCPDDGGSGDFLCQIATRNGSGTYTMSNHALRAEDRGWYFDLPIANARVNGHPALSKSGALVFVANVPTTAICDPGGSSWFFAVNSDNGGAVLKKAGKTDTHESGWFLGDSLGSRPVVIETADDGKKTERAAILGSDKRTQAPPIPQTEPATPSAVPWRRIYWRELL